VGCFRCLDEQGQRAYVSELSRLLRSGGTDLIWAMDSSPSGIPLSPAALEEAFAPGFDRCEKVGVCDRLLSRSVPLSRSEPVQFRRDPSMMAV
jgi:hypothetical protein